MEENKCRLTPLYVHHHDKGRNKYTMYQCECGNQVVIRESSVKSGKTKSCGCLKKEVISERAKENGKLIRQGQLLGKMYANNTTGVTGVHYYRKTKQWIACLIYEGKKHRVCCKSKPEAIAARKQMEKEFGIYEGII